MSTSTIIPKDEPITFLSWLYHRLNKKYNEEYLILCRLADIIHNYSFIKQTIDINYINKICSKHFIQFDLGDGYGFDENFKNQLRGLIVDLISDIGAKTNNTQCDNASNIDFTYSTSDIEPKQISKKIALRK
jgi:hypothetical protein